MTIVSIKNASRHYQDGEHLVKALRGLDLNLEKGEFTAIMGPSGSGKTTLLNLIGGLDTPTEGSVTVSGEEVSSMSKAQRSDLRRDHVGFIFQSYNLIPVLTARENTEFVLFAARRRRRGAPRSGDRDSSRCRFARDGRPAPIRAIGRTAAAGSGRSGHRDEAKHRSRR